MKRLATVFALSLSSLVLEAAPLVDGVSVSQDARGVVSVSYRLTGEDAVITFDVLTNGVTVGGRGLVGAMGDVNCKVAHDDAKMRSFIWNPTVGFRNQDFSSGSVQVKVQAWPLDAPPDYMVVNLRIHNSPAEYYAFAESVPGGVTNRTYKDSKLLMRKIPANGVVWKIGSPSDEQDRFGVWENQYTVSFSSDYYIGVYELTQGQVRWLNDRSACAGSFTADYDDPPVMPYSGQSWAFYRGSVVSYAALCTRQPSSGAFKDYFDKTGIVFDFPTQAEWQFACRAGEAGAYNRSDLPLSDLAWYADNSTVEAAGATRAHPVGEKASNHWGLFDMHGNVEEFVLDHASEYMVVPNGLYQGYYNPAVWSFSRTNIVAVADLTFPQADPIFGKSDDTGSENMRWVGGSYNSVAADCRSAYFHPSGESNARTSPTYGCRLRAPAIAVK